jgi:pimeloyl-ACP methyl ester carboxylesterase
MRFRTFFALIFLAVVWPLAGHASETDFDVAVFGHGRPFLMIPGMSSDMEVWEDAAHRYGVQFQVHRFTLAGFGGKAPVGGPFIEHNVAALKAYIERNDLHNAIVMGHSVGGIIALKLAAEEPDRIANVIVVDILPFLGGAALGAGDGAQAATITERYKAQMQATPAATFIAQQKAQLSTQVSAPDKIDMLDRWLSASDAATIIDATCELYAQDFRPVFTAVKARALVIYAWSPATNLDVRTLDAVYKDQYGGLSGVGLKRIDDSRHFVMFDQRDAFFRAVDDFLSTPVRVGISR